MSFTISNLSVSLVLSPGRKHHWDSFYTYNLTEPNGAVYRVARSLFNGAKEGHHATNGVYVGRKYLENENTQQRLQQYTTQAYAKERNDRVHNEVRSIALIKSAPVVPTVSPHQVLINTLQAQLSASNQIVAQLQQALDQQNQDINGLRQQVVALQNTINGLNQQIVGLLTQVAVIPGLQAQITALATQVTNLTAVMMRINARLGI
ncbi:MAG: hypothetical protein JSR46_11460 [Verrucomicrobia bacterium]|nr:hypothetical protein [Verrucomicrobiota bacterium]